VSTVSICELRKGGGAGRKCYVVVSCVEMEIVRPKTEKQGVADEVESFSVIIAITQEYKNLTYIHR